jgi:hypothetical protein
MSAATATQPAQQNKLKLSGLALAITFGLVLHLLPLTHGLTAPARMILQITGFTVVLWVFQVINPAGDFFYTRAGNFSINAIGQLVLGSASDGRVLQPPMTVPQDTTNITIAPDGTVQVKQAGSNQLTTLGQIQLAQVINPEGMLKMGENLYVATEAAGPVNVGNAGQNGLGMLRQNALEASNVEPVQELIDLITTQRAFELNSQAVQAGDLSPGGVLGTLPVLDAARLFEVDPFLARAGNDVGDEAPGLEAHQGLHLAIVGAAAHVVDPDVGIALMERLGHLFELRGIA